MNDDNTPARSHGGGREDLHNVIVVLTFQASPDQVPGILTAIDPPRLPGFAGDARIAVDDTAASVIAWLDDTVPLPQIDDEMVERAAREAFFSDDLRGHIRGRWTWDTIPEDGRNNYRAMIRAALAAALDASKSEGKDHA